MADTVKTIGIGGDYISLKDWYNAAHDLDDGNRQVGELLHSLDLGGLFRFNGTWPNGGKLRGAVPVNGVKGQGCVITNSGDSTRNILETPAGFEFEDLEFSRDAGYTFQNLGGSIFTRCIVDNSILVSANETPEFNYCVIDTGLDYSGSSDPDVPKITANNCLFVGRIIARAGVDVILNKCISLASDAFLTYTDNVVDLSNSFFRQLSGSDQTGIIENLTFPYYDLNDFVDFAAGDYRLKPDSIPALAGAGPFVLESEGSEIDFPSSEVLNLAESAGFYRATFAASLDNLALSEGSYFYLYSQWPAAEHLNLTESTEAHISGALNSAELLSLTENSTARAERHFSTTDALSLSELSDFNLAANLSLDSVEYLNLQEQAALAVNAQWWAQEWLNLREVSDLSSGGWFSASEHLALQEHSDLSALFNLSHAEQLGLSELSGWQLHLSFADEESLILRELYTLLINDRLQPAILLGLIYNDQVNGVLSTDHLIGVIY